MYERELESLISGKPNVGPKSDDKVQCKDFRWTEQDFTDVNLIKTFFASWNMDISKTTIIQPSLFYSVWMNTGYCPQVDVYNPCTGKNSSLMDVFNGERNAKLCIARGHEKEEDILILVTGSEEEAAIRDDDDFVEIEDVPLINDIDI